jgi:hypothetical protein
VSLRQQYKPSSALQHEYNGKEKSASDSRSSTPPELPAQGSSGDTSNADRWFAKSNKNPKMHNTLDHQDPPFRPDISSPSANGLPYTHMIHHPTPPILDSYASSSEEYRGVIDDLTVQIKKLQKKLKKHERSQDSRLDLDKRVEIKTFGIPVEKKRELEAFLSKFTASLDEPASSHAASSSAFASAAMTNSSTRLPGTTTLKPTNSNSTLIFADSGYGSLTNTGKRSASTSNTTMPPSQPQQAAAAAQAKDAQIASFLQDIPSGLLPHPAVEMTEKARKKLVVMRLEQVLGGRGAGPGVHHQSLQQQEVSQSAASAERSALAAMGRMTAPEGVREASIMPENDEQDMLASSEQHEAHQGNFKRDHIVERDFAAGAAARPEQRPTRPLDLDPDRAQSAAENVQYLQHLGFSLQSQNILQTQSDEEGWVYLNLMIGLAQLHSFNVTTDFVREAVAKYSRTFELSNDGRKVRVRPIGSQSKSSNDESPSSLEQTLQQPLKRSYAAMAGVEPEPKAARHVYTPLFPPKDESMSDEESASITAESTIPQTGFDGETANLSGSGMLQDTGRKKKADAPMIFYQKVRFYTDLSADPAIPMMSLQYGSRKKNPLGAQPVAAHRRDSVQPRYRPLVDGIAYKQVEPVEESALMDLDFPASSPRRVAFVEDNSETLFQASGLHGIYPDDHFSITIARQHSFTLPQCLPNTTTSPKTRSYPNRLIRRTDAGMSAMPSPRTLTTKRTTLPPSELPEPSYGLDEEELDSDDEEDEDHQSEPSGTIPSTTDLPRLAATSAFGNPHKRARHNYGSPSDASYATSSAGARVAPSLSSSASSSVYSDVQMEDDDHRGHSARSDAIDFLAHARTVDPEAIRAMEREYDAHVAERLAEEIPAGSSAATAGGGSGWGSPVGAGKGDDDDAEDDEEVVDGASVSS